MSTRLWLIVVACLVGLFFASRWIQLPAAGSTSQSARRDIEIPTRVPTSTPPASVTAQPATPIPTARPAPPPPTEVPQPAAPAQVFVPVEVTRVVVYTPTAEPPPPTPTSAPQIVQQPPPAPTSQPVVVQAPAPPPVVITATPEPLPALVVQEQPATPAEVMEETIEVEETGEMPVEQLQPAAAPPPSPPPTSAPARPTPTTYRHFIPPREDGDDSRLPDGRHTVCLTKPGGWNMEAVTDKEWTADYRKEWDGKRMDEQTAFEIRERVFVEYTRPNTRPAINEVCAHLQKNASLR